MKFYLGTHVPSWITKTRVPLFLSARRLRGRVSPWPRALGTWALDSGGFSEISLFGGWTTSPRQYAAEVRRWRDEIGGLDWAAIQDWMCEPFMLDRTGLSIEDHQARTVTSWNVLRSIDPELPWAPVLQGWHMDDYLRHVAMYAAAGTDLTTLPVVGLGSVCRRQATGEAEEIVFELAARGLKIHGFGFKIAGLRRVGHIIGSSDSLAWSFGARQAGPQPGCGKRNCANCLHFALDWREKVVDAIIESWEPRRLHPS